jgi:N-terminal C2 in EEIG1 and EHBP1 proteins
VTGAAYVKWNLPHSPSAEHRGKTARAPIKDHKVTWDYEKTVQLRITTDKNGLLQEAELHLEILQEYNSGGRTATDRITLGVVRLNLAEYVDARHDGEDGVVRRHLMQESKINSTLKLAILMTHIEGEKNYTA